MPPTRDLALDPGMWPDQESNRRPFGEQARTQSTVPPQPELKLMNFFISGSFHRLFLDYSWMWVTETTESKSTDKGDVYIYQHITTH